MILSHLVRRWYHEASNRRMWNVRMCLLVLRKAVKPEVNNDDPKMLGRYVYSFLIALYTWPRLDDLNISN